MRRRSAVATIIILVALPAVLAGCSTAAAPRWTFAHASPAAPGASPMPPVDHGGMVSPTPVDGAGTLLGTLVVRAFDIGYEPAALSVQEPGRYLVRFVNGGAVAHDITFADGTMIDAPSGATVEGEVLIPAGGLGFACSIPGHAQAGQQGSVEAPA